MRILLITRDFPPAVGGIQTYCRHLAAGLTALGHEVVVLAPQDQQAPRIDRELDHEVVRLAVPRHGMNPAAVGAITQLCRARTFDASLHALWHTLPGAALAKAVGRLGAIAAIAHGRELLHNEFDRRIRWLNRPYRQLLLRAPSPWFAVSHYTRDLLQAQGVARPNIRVVFGGVDVDAFRPHDPSSSSLAAPHRRHPLLLTVSRLVRRKGIDTVLRALPRIRRDVPDVRYLVGGTGPDARRLRRLRDELGLQDIVTFVGRVDEVELPRLLSAASVFVMPARSVPPDVEGLGLAYLEASACRTAVVGGHAGGVVDAIEDRVSGDLVPPGDADALADTLVGLLTDSRRRGALAEAGHRRAHARFTWDRIARAYADGLTHALDTR